jgi:hypothetical protein
MMILKPLRNRINIFLFLTKKTNDFRYKQNETSDYKKTHRQNYEKLLHINIIKHNYF